MTVLNNILDQVRTTIESLTPDVEPGRTFRESISAEALAQAPKDTRFDRSFTVRQAYDRVVRRPFGDGTITEVDQTMIIEVGYLGRANDKALRTRMNSDDAQIFRRLQHATAHGLCNVTYFKNIVGGQGAQPVDVSQGGNNAMVMTQRYRLTYDET